MSGHIRWSVVMLLAVVAGALLVAYPLLPVLQRPAVYHWDSTRGPAELPLDPYRPAGFQLELAGEPPQGDLVTTVASDEPLLQQQGLRIVGEGDELVVSVAGAQARAPISESGVMYVGGDEERLWVGDDPVRAHAVAGDHRPAIDSLALTPAAREAGVTITGDITADTRFDSRPTATKTAAGVLAAGLFLTAVVLTLLWAPRPPPHHRPRPAHPRHRRPGVEDAVVLAVTAFGVLAGGPTDDDGFIRLIAGTPDTAGFIGNAVRWNNVPEAPFGWQYHWFAWVGRLTWEPVFLRIGPWAVALLGWLLLRYGLVPRLLPGGVGAWSRVVLTATFCLGWLVYGNSLRPELLFAVGTAAVFWLVLIADQRRSVAPLVLACPVASWTIATGPTGLWAVTPLLVAFPVLWGRWLRHLDRGFRTAAALVGVVGLGTAFLGMFADQGLGTVIAATDARTAYGPVYPVWMDPLRYYRLYMSFATRQIVTYWAVTALAAVLVLVVGRRVPTLPGVRARWVRWMVWTTLALVPVLALGPTKLPHHFGALLLFGPLAAAVWTQVVRDATSPRVRPWLTGVSVGVLCALTGLAFHRANTWWKLGTLGQVADTTAVAVAGREVWPVLVAGGLALGVVAWATHRRWAGAARWWAAALVLAQVAFAAGTYGNTAQAMLRRDPLDPAGPYTVGGAALGALRGEQCRLERSLVVEPQPSAGVLPVPGMRVRVGLGLPVWTAAASGTDRYDSGWIAIPDAARRGELPIVVPVAGADAHHRVRVEYAGAPDGSAPGTAGEDLDPILKFLGTSDFSDIRVHPPAGAERFRVIAESDGPATWRRQILDGAPAPGPNGAIVPFAVAAPRVPRVVPLLDLVGDATVATAWNLAFFTPCLRQPAQGRGVVEVPDFVLSDSERPGSIAFSAKNGGPFASVIGLREPVRVPLYSPGDHTEQALNALDLIELRPTIERATLQPVGGRAPAGERLRWGWEAGPDVALPGAGGA